MDIVKFFYLINNHLQSEEILTDTKGNEKAIVF